VVLEEEKSKQKESNAKSGFSSQQSLSDSLSRSVILLLPQQS
jgi:hypothetical protein